MRSRFVLLSAGVLMLGAAGLALYFSATPAQADFCAPLCAPCVVGGSCECTTTVVPNVVCLRDGGGGGHVVITSCTSCPPPCHEPGCPIQFCRTRNSATCE